MSALSAFASVATILGGVGVIGGGMVWLWKMSLRLHQVFDLVEKVERRSVQLDRNGGTSLADSVHRIERRLDILEKWMVERG